MLASYHCQQVCLKLCEKIIGSQVEVCKNTWSYIQALCLLIKPLLIEYQGDTQDIIVCLGQIESLQKTLARIELINLQYSSFGDLVRLKNDLFAVCVQLGVSTKNHPLGIGEEDFKKDKPEWETFQLEQLGTYRTLDYCFAAAGVPSLQPYIFNEELSDEEADVALKLAKNLKKSKLENSIVNSLYDLESLIKVKEMLKRIRNNTNQEVVQANVKIHDVECSSIGKGASGEIFKVNYDGKLVAMKRLRPDVMEYRVEKEVIAMAALKYCANVVKLLGYYIDGMYHCIVMDLYHYGSLYNYLHPDFRNEVSIRDIPLNINTKIQMAIGITNGLAAIHKLKLTHRDMKSLNVFLREDFHVSIGDFDLVKIDGTSGLNGTLSETSIKSICSLYWRAPETLPPNYFFTQRSDIWALGIVIWELFTEETPYYEENDLLLVQAFIKNHTPPGSLSNVDYEIASVILDCWKSKPEERPTAEQILQRLKKIRDNKKTSLLKQLQSMNLSEVSTLLKSGVDLSMVDCEANGINALHYAVKANEMERAQLYLQHDISLLNREDFQGWTPLHYASSLELLSMVEWLIAEGADINSTDKENNTPLNIAARVGNLEIVKCFVSEGGILGETPYRLALDARKWDVALWLESRSSGEMERQVGDWSILHIATEEGDLEKVQWLIKHGYDLNEPTLNGTTPLHIALAYQHQSIIQFLLNKICMINCVNNDGITPLMIVENQGDLKELLTKHCINSHEEQQVKIIYRCNQRKPRVAQEASLRIEVEKAVNEIMEQEEEVQDEREEELENEVEKEEEEVILERGEVDSVFQEELIQTCMIIIEQGDLDKLRNVLAGATVNFDGLKDLLFQAVRNGQLAITQWLIPERELEEISELDEQGNSLLHLAAESGNIGLFLWLLKGTDLDPTAHNYQGQSSFSILRKKSDEQGNTYLHQASVKGDLEFVKWLVLEAGIDIYKLNNNRKSALFLAESYGNKQVANWLDMLHKAKIHEAAKMGDTGIVQWLIGTGRNSVNHANERGWTPLHLAARGGHLSLVSWLVDKAGANVNAIDKDKWTPLHFAAREGHLQVVKKLVMNSKAEVNIKDLIKWSPTNHEHSKEYLDLIKWLILAVKADINQVEQDGLNPLHYAAHSGKLEIVKLLVEIGNANVDARGRKGWTPLHWASKDGQVEVAKWLIINGRAQVNLEDEDKATPLHLSVRNGIVSLIECLINKGSAMVEVKDNNGMTPLHYAARDGKVDIAQFLALNGAALDSRDKDEWTSLHWAAYCDRLDMVVWLVLNGAQIDATTNEGRTPLHWAAFGEDYQVAAYLIKTGTNVNIADMNGSTPLHCGAESGNLEFVKLLVLEGKADTAVVNKQGETPYSQATADVKAWLMENGGIKRNKMAILSGRFHWYNCSSAYGQVTTAE